jgi:hypothetical protein
MYGGTDRLYFELVVIGPDGLTFVENSPTTNQVSVPLGLQFSEHRAE